MRQMVFGLWGIGILLGFSHNLYAQTPRDQEIAYLTELYGANEAIKLYDERQVREAVEIFARRVNFRDVKSLTGLLNGDQILSSSRSVEEEKHSPVSIRTQGEHLGSPQKREFITTAAQDYTIEERKLLHSDLLDLFLRVPPHVRFDFKIQSIAVTGNLANADIIWAFKVREVETPKTRTFTARAPAHFVLQLKRDDNNWLVTDLKNIATRIASNVAD